MAVSSIVRDQPDETKGYCRQSNPPENAIDILRADRWIAFQRERNGDGAYAQHHNASERQSPSGPDWPRCKQQMMRSWRRAWILCKNRRPFDKEQDQENARPQIAKEVDSVGEGVVSPAVV
jgi:hypothetical protein